MQLVDYIESERKYSDSRIFQNKWHIIQYNAVDYAIAYVCASRFFANLTRQTLQAVGSNVVRLRIAPRRPARHRSVMAPERRRGRL
jgi:hypothetical protein